MSSTLDISYRAFLNFTLAKRRESLKDFSEGQREAFIMVPFLLHTSEPKRLGYVRGQLAPCGIYGYKYSDEIKAIGRKHFSTKDKFEDPKQVAEPPILSLSLMGSAGSIAQTKVSDLDYWVTISPELRGEQLKRLQLKLTGIEKWCWEELKAEVHFFVSDAKAIRDNNFGQVDKESCGTALGKLLKEEYYRTSLHVVGKIPVWWLAPYNGNDEAYAELLRTLPHSGLEAKDFIDFGNIRSIPTDEFVGGGMWQLNKGVGSPFKSALKMALLVEYADTEKPRDLLAQMLKRRMLENPGDMEQLDPYQMMVERVIQLYRDRGELEVATLLQRCLFIKMGLRVSRWWDAKKLPPHRTPRTMVKLLKSWGWTLKDVVKWQDFDLLPMVELVQLKRELEHYMFTSLQALRSSAVAGDFRAVSSGDFKKMTQRLATVFNPDPHRTEWFYAPYDRMIRSQVYSIQEEKMNGMWHWNLYEGVVDAEGSLVAGSARKLIRSCLHLQDLATWMLYNQLVRLDSKMFISHRRDIPFGGNLKRLSNAYREFIGKPQLPDLDTDAFGNDSFPTKLLVVVNLVPLMELEEDEELLEEGDTSVTSIDQNLIAGELAEALTEAGYEKKADEVKTKIEDPTEQVLKVGDKTLPIRAGRVPHHEDPLNAGPEDCSVFQEIFIIELNSWGEVYCRKVQGEQPVAQALASMVTSGLKRSDGRLEMRCELGFGPYHQKAVQDRFMPMLERMATHMVESKRDNSVAIFKVDGWYTSVIREGDRLTVHRHEHFYEAVQHANLYVEGSVDFIFDLLGDKGREHQAVYDQSKLGQNALHITEAPDACVLSCIDQTGRYLFDHVSKKDFQRQWPPLLLSYLGAVRQWGIANTAGKLRIIREKCGNGQALGEGGVEITKQIFTVFQKMKDKLPRTQMAVSSKGARRWMLAQSEEDQETLEIQEELRAALKVHGEDSPEAFLLSSVQIKDAASSQGQWPPALQLQLRQGLIHAGRKLQKARSREAVLS